MKKNLFLVFFVILFSACGGGGGTASSSTTTKTAYFYDSAVNGLEYKCGNKISGITGDAGNIGSFRYQDDCLVEFSIGKIYLGNIEGEQIASGLKIFPTTILGLENSTIDERVENMLVLLQTIDSDNNASNGIDINSSVRNILTNSTISNSDFTTSSNIEISDLNITIKTISPTKELVDVEEALLHFQQTLNENNKSTVVNLVNPTPYLIDSNGKFVNLDSIKTRGTIAKDIIIKGESGAKIFLASNNSGITPQLNEFNYTMKTIGSDRKGYLTLDVSDENKTNFYYFINLAEDTTNSYTDINISKTLDLNISRDFIPPHIETTNIEETVQEEQIFFRNINATDAGIIKIHKIVDLSEDNRSTDAVLFIIDQNGTVTFKDAPNFDININAVFNVIARVIDFVGNMTDVFLKVHLLNILDNPPAIKNNSYTVSILEGLPNDTFIFNLSSSVEDNLTKAPDNNSTLSPIYYNLYNHTDKFQIDRNTGIISIKDSSNTFFDFEKSSNTIDLNVSIENNNTRVTPSGDLNVTYVKLTVNILNKIDTAPKLINPSEIYIDEESTFYSSNYPITTIAKDENISDKNMTMSFTISGGNSGNNFEINSTTGVLHVNAINTLDFEIQPKYILTIRATNTWYDGSVTYDEVNQTINLNDKIDNPPVIVLKTSVNSVPESTANNITIATFDVNGTKYDENVTTSYEIVSTIKNTIEINTSTPFTIDSSGRVSTSRYLLNDYAESISNSTDTIFRVTIKARNQWWNGSYNYSNPVSFDVNVTNVIDNPPLLISIVPTITIDENATIGTLIYDLDTNGTIYDENNITSFAITSGNETNIFDMNSTTGAITLKNTLDWETATSYVVGVKATNTDHNNVAKDSGIKLITIHIRNIIEKIPSITGPTALDLHENIDQYELIAIIESNGTSLDEQTIDAIQIVSGDSANKFEITMKTDSSTLLKYGELKIKETLDYETKSNYTLEINATNTKGSATHIINIDMLDDVEKDLPLLVIAMEYDDINVTTTLASIENLISKEGTVGSKYLKNYFERVSKGKFYFKPAIESYDPDTLGIIKVKLSGNHPQDGTTALDNDIKEALQLADPYVDFSSFDTKKIDGNISSDELQMLFIVAGGERTYGDTNRSILAKTGSIDSNVTLDGVNVAYTIGGGNYAVVGEMQNGKSQTIGLLSKMLSESTLKFKKQGDSYTYGDFDLMGTGYNGIDGNETLGTTPVHPSVFNKVIQGWTTPTLLKSNTIHNLVFNYANNVISYNTYKIQDPTDINIYYLLEYRDSSSSSADNNNYDNGLYKINNNTFSGGLKIWKFDSTLGVSKIVESVIIANSSDNVFRPSNATTALPVNSAFELLSVGTINSASKVYSIGIKTK